MAGRRTTVGTPVSEDGARQCGMACLLHRRYRVDIRGLAWCLHGVRVCAGHCGAKMYYYSN